MGDCRENHLRLQALSYLLYMWATFFENYPEQGFNLSLTLPAL